MRNLQEGIEKPKKEKAVQVYWSILANVREEKSTAERLLLLYKDILSDEQKKGSLVEIARWGVVSKCEDLLKENLKSPKSYTQYSVSTTGPSLQDDGQYYIGVDIKYGANNSFNAEVTDTAQFDVYYTIDVENLTYNYKDVDFSAYYKF